MLLIFMLSNLRWKSEGSILNLNYGKILIMIIIVIGRYVYMYL